MDTLLSKIDSPEDLKLLKLKQLPQLCEEIREFLIENAAINGGHFGSSLGVVELTVALHYVFDTPNDKLIWDVGHQAYVHKILTGRRNEFHTNRKKDGLCGFTKQSESPYDAFVAGHASISVSAALGMATAAKLQKKNHKHIAIIGDGALTGGIAYEGLNNAGDSDTDLLVIVNDNQISIDPNVGATTKMLTNISTSRPFNKLRNSLKSWLQHGGKYGRKIDNKARTLEKSIKNLVFSHGNFFESLDFRYFGPLDGHNVIKTVHILQDIKNYPGPKILHCLTTKGKGFDPAEKEQVKWHATTGFDRDKTQSPQAAQEEEFTKYQDVFGQTLVELAEKDEQIIGITPAMPSGCSMNQMMEKFPDRAFDVGIAEQHAVTFAAGLATQGLIPFCNIYSTFAQRAYDQIIHDVCIESTPVRFCFDRAGLVGEDGETHQGAFDLAYLRVIPNLIIASPRNEIELRNLMYTFSQYSKGPTCLRYPKGKGQIQNWKQPFQKLEIGKGECLKSGSQTAIISLGPIAHNVTQAIIDTDIAHYDLRFLAPLDTELLHSIGTKFTNIITVEEGVSTGGMGSAILEFMSKHNYEVKIQRLGIPHKFIPHCTIPEQQKICGIDVEGIKDAIEKIKKYV